MASPFSIFRRYQGMLLAVFGVALMIAFVVLPAVIQLQQTRGGGPGHSGDAVMTWTGGEVTESDIGNLMQRRQMVVRFLQQLQESATNRPGGEDLNRRRDGGILGRLQNNTRASAVETMVLSQKGEDVGLSVSDAAVRAFLHNVTDDMFSKEGELDAAISLAIDNSTTPAAIFGALKSELLAHHVLIMGFGSSMTTPSEAWEYFNRLNRRVSAEFVPFATSDYIAKVPEPSARELDDYFEEHKLQLPSFNSDTVGFKVPRKVEIYYVAAEFDKFLQAAKADVTTEEIAAYYEENKGDFRIFEDDFPDFSDPSDPRNATPQPPIVPDDEVSGEEATDAPTPPPADETSPEDADSDSDDSENKEPSNPETSEGDSASEDSPGGCQDEPVADPIAEDGESEPATEPVEPADVEAVEPDDTTPDGESTTDESDSSGETSDDDLALPEPKYKPLEDVEEQIRSELARPRAQEKLDTALGKVRKAIDTHYEKMLDFDLEGKEDPGLFDGKALAEELGLSHGTTGLIDIVSLYEDRKKIDIVESSQTSGPQPQGFMQLAFGPGRLKYQPMETRSFDPEKSFLSWKVAEEEAYVPELKDIKDKVVTAWKTEQARELAKAAADKFADRLDDKKSLKDQLGSEHKVILPPAFSYFTQQSVEIARLAQKNPQMGFYRPQPDLIEEIEEQSLDVIRKEVVNMPVDTIRVLPTADKSIYYVVRLASDTTPAKEARDDFMLDIVESQREGLPGLMLYAAGNDPQEVVFDWYEGIEEEYKVKRIKPEYFLDQGN